ncbi:methyltransferase [uncultured Dechloromonas sp.]|uniref:methyltransferase n=1 Tax=uncultured Dechloromonas sp. TaxID=171719 RepID=UPI0025DC3FFC|nr:methyltransferase [uncultured Dechloromonas sp.]
MRAAERRRQLDAELLAHRDLWHPQPFREARPAWCERWPALTAALLALDDADVAHLNDDTPAALRWLAAYLPDVDVLLPLIDIPLAARVPPPVPGERWAWEIPGRKRSQIEAFAGAVQPGGEGVIDWCGGKGHLGRLLGLAWQQPVHTLEIDAALCGEGEQLARRIGLNHRFLERDALAVADWPRQGQHAVALHACGNLHRRLLEHGAGAGVSRFDVAPCCYYRGVETHYQPLVASGSLQLTRDDTRLAVTETVTATPRLTRQRDQGIAWKLAFTAWRAQVSDSPYKTFKPVPAPWLRGSFADFLARMAAREGLPPPEARHLASIEATGWQRQREVLRLSIPRHAFRRALELWLVLDLAQYLETCGYAHRLATFCDRHLTPRNLLLSAWRS